jgi:hypothetical protein
MMAAFGGSRDRVYACCTLTVTSMFQTSMRLLLVDRACWILQQYTVVALVVQLVCVQALDDDWCMHTTVCSN